MSKSNIIETPVIQYHLTELAIAQNTDDPRHIMPVFKADQRVILDIGCGIGQTFIAAGLNQEESQRILLALDLDETALLYGQQNYQGIHYICGEGASLPFADCSIDLVISRVSLPHTNIPKALTEIGRVLKPGGCCWLTLHPFHMALERFWKACRQRSLKSVLFQCYVLANGAILHFTGQTYAFPFTQRYESFQTQELLRKLLIKQGFGDLHINMEQHFLVTGRKK